MSFLYAQKMHITIILRLGFFFAGKKDQMTQRVGVTDILYNKE